MLGTVGLSPGPWSPHPAWGHTVSTTMATIPAMLTVPKVSAMYHTHCARHLPVPLFPPRLPYPPWFPSHPAQHTRNHQTPHDHHSCCTQCPHTCCIHLICHVYSTHHTPHHPQHTYCANPNLPCWPYQSCCAHRAHRTYCACSVVHLHRKHPRWLCRQKACVCQAIEQERLEGLLLREGAARQRGTERERHSETEGGRLGLERNEN